jgi:hypothetical protein
MRVCVDQDDVNIFKHRLDKCTKLLLMQGLVVKAAVAGNGLDAERVIDERFPEGESSVENVSDAGAALGLLQSVAQTPGGIEVNSDDAQAAGCRGCRECVARSCLANATFQ